MKKICLLICMFGAVALTRAGNAVGYGEDKAAVEACQPADDTMSHAFSLVRFPGLKQDAFIYRDTCRQVDGRFPGFSPFFLVYPDKTCNLAEASALLEEMGMQDYLHKYSATVCVMNPSGRQYHAEDDGEAFRDFVSRMRVISNLKVVGVGEGATFVNRVVARLAEPVAGIATIGGKPLKGKPGEVAVPAYIAGSGSKQVADAYIRQNKAVKTGEQGALTFYANREEPLQQVVVSRRRDASLKEFFKEAWDNLLSKNYRFNNFKHTWYTGCTFGQHGPYELEPYIMPEKWGVTRRVVQKDLLGTGTCLWYEYHPEATLKAGKGTVPLLLLLHGNNNDPRTQAETSGFIELCAEKNFVVAELEWQGNGYAYMGMDGIEQVVYDLLATYPQLDPSRVYAEGLSAGSATATGLGIRKSHVFAAVGGFSAGVLPDGYRFGYSKEALLNEAIQKRGVVEMPYFSITGTDDDVVPFLDKDNWRENSFFCAWQVYQTMNGLPVSQQPDFNADATFGIALENRETIETNKGISMETGVLTKEGVPLIRLVAVNDYGHWNFKPAARMMWDYFMMFSRDPETRKLVYHKPVVTDSGN